MDDPRDAFDLRAVRTLGDAVRVFFGHSSPRFLLINACILLAWRAWQGGAGWPDLLAVGGVAVGWPFMEWFLHQYSLHAKPRTIAGMKIDLLPARSHRAHHKHPWRAGLVFLPIQALWVLAPLNVGLWWTLMPTWSLALSAASATAVMALLYEWTHYMTHTFVRPRTRYYAWICRRHRLHHFKHEAYWHGFVVPLVDDVMGTAPNPADIASSPRCRDLDLDPEPTR